MKETFDKVVMDEKRKAEMREMILRHKRTGKPWIITAAGIAAAIALIMIIPFTRTVVVNAAERLISAFRSHNGEEVVVSEDPTERAAEVDYSNAVDYAKVKDGRLYFVLDDQWTDVTDLCSASEYYRYEIKNEDGSREVILVGGTPDNYGWWGLLFDSEGAYYWNHGSIPEKDANPEWYLKGCFDEGVRSGNPEYDDLLEQQN